MHFHLAYFQLSQITHQMMRRLYLKATTKYDAWETIRLIMNSVDDFSSALPTQLRMENLERQSEIIQRQAVFLDFIFNHTINVCSRPILVRSQPSNVPPSVAQYRRSYCQNLANIASNRIASNMEYRRVCGYFARMLFTVTGIFVTASKVLTYQAIASPKDSPVAKEACRHLNKLLALYSYSSRPGPFTAQSMAIIKALIRTVIRINDERSTESSSSSRAESAHLGIDVDGLEAQPQADSNIPQDLLDGNHPFPELVMDDLIWGPEGMSLWENENEWSKLI